MEETIGLLNVGTSLQFSAVLPPTLNHTRFSNRAAPPSVQSSPKGGDTQRMKTAPASEIRPFFHGQRMLVAAALSGGNSLTTFARSVQGWSKELNPAAKELPLDVVFDALNRTHEELDQAQNKLTGEDQNGLKFDPRFEGERGQPEARASIGNIGAANFTLGHMWASLQDGLIQNVLQMLGGSKRAQELKLSRIICVGGSVFICASLLVQSTANISVELSVTVCFFVFLNAEQSHETQDLCAASKGYLEFQQRWLRRTVLLGQSAQLCSLHNRSNRSHACKKKTTAPPAQRLATSLTIDSMLALSPSSMVDAANHSF